jgi:hypothetical protein
MIGKLEYPKRFIDVEGKKIAYVEWVRGAQ